MFSIWINEISSSLDGYSVDNTNFLALVKVLHTSGDISKVFTLESFFFQISAICILYFAKMKERRRSFLKGARKGDINQIARSFLYD